MTRRGLGLVLVMTVMLGAAAEPVCAYIKRMYSLAQVLGETKNVAICRMVKFDQRGKTAVMRVEKMIKGKLEYRLVNMNLGTAPAHHTAYLRNRNKITTANESSFRYRKHEQRRHYTGKIPDACSRAK